MPIKRGHRDPRTEAERKSDEEVLANFEAGKFLALTPDREAAAIERVEAAYETGRKLAANLGSQLGTLRRGRGMSQEELARLVGTKKSNISRLETGREGGISIERFLAIFQVLSGSPAQATVGRLGHEGLIHEAVFERFRDPIDCLESA
jgi:ribosome-binding protein aMBF1 (putative translation factor)